MEAEHPLNSCTPEIEGIVELSLNTVVGISNLGTIKVKGKVENEEVIVLVDCGATLNFISPKIVEKMKLSVTNTVNYGVIMGTGSVVRGKGICKNVVLSLAGLTIREDFLPLELGSVDLILGMQWLRTLGTTTVDWKNLT